MLVTICFHINKDIFLQTFAFSKCWLFLIIMTSTLLGSHIKICASRPHANSNCHENAGYEFQNLKDCNHFYIAIPTLPALHSLTNLMYTTYKINLK